MFLTGKTSNKYLYASEKTYELTKDINPPTIMVNSSSGCIPNKHRWVELCKISSNSHISSNWNVVRLVDVNNGGESPINTIISASSDYARFTNYWLMSSFGKSIVVKDTDTPKPIKTNHRYFPIFKPYAVCNLVALCPDRPPFTYDTINMPFMREIRKNYKDKFIKTINLNSNSDVNVNRKIVQKYSKVLAGMKVEFYSCHGDRQFFNNGDTSANNGKSFICISNTASMDWPRLNKIHETSKYWCGDNLCLAMISECCYGQGVRQSATSVHNSNLVLSNLNEVAPNIDNFLFIAGANAGTVGWGNGNASDDSLLKRKVFESSETYG